MKLSSRTQYGIKAMIELSLKESSTSLQSLTNTQHISLSYLEQIFAALRKNGLVKSVRGPGGGYLLAKPAEQITIKEIVTAIDNGEAKSESAQSLDDSARDMWSNLNSRLEEYLGHITLAELMSTNDYNPSSDKSTAAA